LIAWISTDIATPASVVETSTSAIASVFGATNIQSGTGAAAMISSVLRSRSRQTSSPA
jgi:hypothetical protein